MIKKTKKIISVILSIMMVISCCSALIFTVNAATAENSVKAGTLPSKYYQTNPNNMVGKNKTITIDGDYSDWSEDMLIAQGAAWDVANHWKGGHENCVLDTYSLYAAWDSSNLYVAWQMVNTTDTWAREGDGSLSDGGRVLDVPLILALSVDPNSTSMSNKNIEGGPIWGQKMGVTFDTHVDRLLYMSGKPGNGTPAMFKAVDANGNTDYESGCLPFAGNGIEYKMAEGNMTSSIMGLNYSEDPDDVFSESSDWVDYKTFQGQKGVHDTKYDSFYEIKIPLTTLGIDVNYLQNNGIGAMLIATRGESALDCIPYDPSMIDNALDSYGSDPSTSHEKDDDDVITVPFARIGTNSGDTPVPQPTTVKPTTAPQPTVAPTTGSPVVPGKLNVTATSNVAKAVTNSFSTDGNPVNVKYNLTAKEKIVDLQYKLTYDPTKLKISNKCFNDSGDLLITPGISSLGSDYVNNSENGVVYGNFLNVNGFDFSKESALIDITFDIIGEGNAAVNLEVQELDTMDATTKLPKIVVNDGVPQDNFNSLCSSTAEVKEASDIPTVPDDNLKVNSVSNLVAQPISKTYSEDNSTVNIKLYFECAERLANGQFEITYDSTKLKLNKSSLDEDGYVLVTPEINKTGSATTHMTEEGKIVGNYSNGARPYNFVTEKVLFDVTFDIIGTGETTVNFNMLEMDYINTKTYERTMLVEEGKVLDAFYNLAKGRFEMSDSVTPGPYILGDADLDGSVTIKDAALIQLEIAGMTTFDEQQTRNSDVDKDGDIGIKDVAYIQLLIAELIDSFDNI